MPGRKASETEYEFTLVLAGIGELTSAVEDALFEAGCDDATISVRFGRVFLIFSRLAASLEDAILNAIKDVRKARIGAEVLRVDHDQLVSQSEIARRIGRTRQLIHQYINGMRGPGDFPPPVSCIDEAPLWNWREVAQWLRQNDMIPEAALREANVLAAINGVLDLEHLHRENPALTGEVLRVLTDGRTLHSA